MARGLTREQLEQMGAQRTEAKSFKELKQMGAQPVQDARETSDPRGFLETMLKRPVERLVMEPARRTGEAIGSAVAKPFLSEEQEQRRQESVQEDKSINVPLLGEFQVRGLGGDETGKQIAGETLETASWLIPPAKAGPVVGLGFKGLGQAAKGGASLGAVSGGLGGAGVALQEGENPVVGAALGAATGGALGAAVAPLPAVIPAIRRTRIQKTASEADRLSTAITQGKTKDIPVIQRRVRDIDAEGINNYDDLIRAFNDKVGALAQKSDEITGTRKTPIQLGKWATKTRVGNKSVKQNYVGDALDHLEEGYRKTNQPAEAERIVQLRQKAESVGVTPTEGNQIAREYGIEFGQRAFSKTGEPLTSVNAQAFENTRKGIKKTVRNFVNDEAFTETDKAMSDFIRLRELSKRVHESANKLRGRTQRRGLGEKVGRGVFELVDMLSFRSAGGFLRAVMPRGAGFKVFNAIDLEKNLQKNLTDLQKALNATSERGMLDGIADVLENFGKKLQ